MPAVVFWTRERNSSRIFPTYVFLSIAAIWTLQSNTVLSLSIHNLFCGESIYPQSILLGVNLSAIYSAGSQSIRNLLLLGGNLILRGESIYQQPITAGRQSNTALSQSIRNLTQWGGNLILG